MKTSFLKIFLAVVLLLIWLVNVDVKELLAIFSQVNLVWLIPVLLSSALVMILSALRLMLLVKSEFPANYFYFLKLNLVGVVASLLVPANSGGFLRAYLLKRRYQSSFSKAFGFVLVDFIFGVMTFVIVAFIGFISFFLKGIRLKFTLAAILFFLVFLVIGLIVFIRPVWVKKLSCSVINLIFPSGQLKTRILRAKDEFWKAFAVLSGKPKRMIVAFFISVVIVVLSGLSVYLLFRSFGVTVGLIEVVLAAAISGFINSIPSTPAKVGQYELVGLVVYSVFLGIGRNLAGAVVLLAHLVEVTFVLLVTAVVYLLFISEKDFKSGLDLKKLFDR